MKILILLMFFSLALNGLSQFIDVETEKFKGVKQLTIKTFGQGTRGYRTIYYFDEKGNAQESLYYFKHDQTASYIYKYNDLGLITEAVLSLVSGKDFGRDVYSYDSKNRLIARTSWSKKCKVEESYEDFDLNNNALTSVWTDDQSTTVTKRKFDSLNRIILIEKFIDDSLIYKENLRYNAKGDIVYSYIPTFHYKGIVTMNDLLYFNRRSMIETYKYKYDKQNRWTKKWVMFDNRKVLTEKRKYN